MKNFMEDFREMKEKVSSLEVTNQRLKRENYDLKSDVKIYKKRLQEFGNVEGMSEELKLKQKKLMEMNRELIENDKLLQRFEDELDKKDERINKLRVKLGAKEEEIHKLKYKLNEYQKRLEKVSSNEHKITLLIKENKRLKKELANRPTIQRSPSPKPNNSSMVSNENDSEMIKALELKLKDLMALIEKLRKEIEDYKERYEKAVKECKFWEQQRDEIAEKLHDLEGLLEIKKEELMRKILTISMMSVKLTITMAGLKASRNRIVNLEKNK
jgi:chromosome segregation ATPase